MKREKIIKDLESGKEYIEDSGKIYFKALSGYIVSLPKDYYFKRKEELREFFSKRDERDQKRLVLENLSLFATPLPDREYHPKMEIVYQSAFCTVVKFSDYPPSEDCKDVHGFKGLTDLRETDMNPWRTERNDWVWELAKKVKREIFGSD